MTAHQKNVASRKGGKKLYIGINIYLHVSDCPIKMQSYENATLKTVNKTIDDEEVCSY
jgi:hypothetical protein